MARNGFSASEPWGRREAACCLCQGLFYREEPRQRTLWESLELLGRHIQTSAHTCGPHQTHEDRLWPENNGTWGSPDKVVTIFIEPPRVRHPVASGHVSPTCFPSSPLGPSSLNSILSWIVFLCPHRDVSDHSTQITLCHESESTISLSPDHEATCQWFAPFSADIQLRTSKAGLCTVALPSNSVPKGLKSWPLLQCFWDVMSAHCTAWPWIQFHAKPEFVSIFFQSSVLSHPNCASSQIIMWMLKQERGMIDIMFKINQFFPSRLPQYQNQCVSLCVCTFLSVLKYQVLHLKTYCTVSLQLLSKDNYFCYWCEGVDIVQCFKSNLLVSLIDRANMRCS